MYDRHVFKTNTIRLVRVNPTYTCTTVNILLNTYVHVNSSKMLRYNRWAIFRLVQIGTRDETV